MKRIISIWLLALALMCAFSGSVLSEETPYVPPPSSGEGGDDTGDGHPWGGDDKNSGNPGGNIGQYKRPVVITGLPAIDFVYFILKQEWILSRQSVQSTVAAPNEIGGTVYRSQNIHMPSYPFHARRPAARNGKVQQR